MTQIVDPAPLDALIGMSKPKRMLFQDAVVIKSKDVPFPHTILIGNSGCGKTTLVRAISNMLGIKLYEIHGQTLADSKDTLYSLLTALRARKDRAHLFIDEVHQLPAKAQEFFFPIMEKQQITLFVATTDPGKLVRPFQNRFARSITVELYTSEELAEIVIRKAKKDNFTITKSAANVIASRSRGVPRVALEHLDAARNKVEFIALGAEKLTGQSADSFVVVNKDIVTATYEDLEIWPLGITKHEMAILTTLLNVEYTSIKSLCSITEIDTPQYEQIYEPFLLKMGFVEKSSRGRRITDRGRQYLDEVRKAVA